jgi:hypothetical protein
MQFVRAATKAQVDSSPEDLRLLPEPYEADYAETIDQKDPLDISSCRTVNITKPTTKGTHVRQGLMMQCTDRIDLQRQDLRLSDRSRPDTCSLLARLGQRPSGFVGNSYRPGGDASVVHTNTPHPSAVPAQDPPTSSISILVTWRMLGVSPMLYFSLSRRSFSRSFRSSSE